MNKIISTHVIYRGKQIPVASLKENSNIKVVVECKHGQREIRWLRRHRPCRKCAAELGSYSTSSKGRKVTWGNKISEAKKGKQFTEEHKDKLIESRKKNLQPLLKHENKCEDNRCSSEHRSRQFIMLCGQSGVGKTTLLESFRDKFNIIAFDKTTVKALDHFIRNNYHCERPIVLDIPIKISTMYKRYCDRYNIHMVFMVESIDVVESRIKSRGGSIKSVASRHKRLQSLANRYADFVGDTEQVREYLDALKV